MKFEIKSLFRLPSGQCMPCGLKLWDRLWWRFVPGVIIKVRWPKGMVKVGANHRQGWIGIGEYYEYVESTDPNDHYRPVLEKYVGQQGKHWNWGFADTDVNENKLTIKIVKSKSEYASYFVMLWS